MHKQNSLTELQLEIPRLEREVKKIKEENHILLLEKNRLFDPLRLLKYKEDNQFQYLHYPNPNQVEVIYEK